MHDSLRCEDIAGASSMTLIPIDKPTRNYNLNISDIEVFSCLNYSNLKLKK